MPWIRVLSYVNKYDMPWIRVLSYVNKYDIAVDKGFKLRQ